MIVNILDVERANKEELEKMRKELMIEIKDTLKTGGNLNKFQRMTRILKTIDERIVAGSASLQ